MNPTKGFLVGNINVDPGISNLTNSAPAGSMLLGWLGLFNAHRLKVLEHRITYLTYGVKRETMPGGNNDRGGV